MLLHHDQAMLDAQTLDGSLRNPIYKYHEAFQPLPSPGHRFEAIGLPRFICGGMC
jgi:hypothetical protein